MNSKMLTGMAFLGFFLIGLIGSAFAPVFPFLIRDFGLPLAVAGLVFPVRSIGGCAGTLLGGIWSDTVGRKLMVLMGTIIQVIAMALVEMTQNWSFALVGFLLLGVGGGFLTAGLNALVVEVNPQRRGMALNMVHGVYGFGSLAGPLVSAVVLASTGTWQVIFVGSGVLWAVFVMVSLIPTYPVPTGRRAETKVNVRSLLINPTVLLLLTMPFLYGGISTGLVGWITTYAQTVVRLPVFVGASLVSLFYGGITLGRFVCGALTDRIGYGRTMFWLALGVAVSYPLVLVSYNPLVIGLGAFLFGCFCSGLYPISMAWATQMHPTGAGTATGIMSTGMSLGGMVVPPLMGWAADSQGLGFSMTANYVGAVLLVMAASGLLRMQVIKAQSLAHG